METWDILDENGSIPGRTILRGKDLKAGEYHLVVHIWIINSKGEVLIQKRPEYLAFAPGIWATTGGSAIVGEDSITAALREVKEELGININRNSMLSPLRIKRKNDFTDIWVVKQDIELIDIKLQKEEVEDAKWVNKKELKEMILDGSFYRYSDVYFQLLSKYIQIF
ncbi:MAG: NUDIX domain-containing protein [Tissierella sp.]|nr:NUDIX domain-containing protein [Tissierella sp.]